MSTIVFNVDPARQSTQVTSILRDCGLEVQEISSLSECVSQAATQSPALIVLSPEISAAEIAQAPGFSPLGQHTKILQRVRGRITWPPDPSTDAFVSEPVEAGVLARAALSLIELSETQQKVDRLQSQLDRSRQDLSTCLTHAAHDLSEPLRAFETTLELLRLGGMGRFSSAESTCIDLAKPALERSKRLIRDLSAFSQIARGSSAAHRKIGLEVVVAAALAQHRRVIDDSRADIRVGPLPAVTGDPPGLQQLVALLIGNALKFRRPDQRPEIVIQASRESDDRWVVAIADNGIGIALEDQPSIFLPFHRLHGRDVPGSGLGLTLAQRIVENHGGTVRVESAPGKGATFLMSLPDAKA